MSAATIAIVQARMTSSRLPGKVLLPLAGAPLIQRMLERVVRINGLDGVCLAVPTGTEHDEIIDAAAVLPEVRIFRGDEYDVLSRTFHAARENDANIVMRVTSDCPLIDPDVSSAVLAAFKASTVDYARTAFTHGYPHGFDTEVFKVTALATAYKNATDLDEREHVTPYIWRRPETFSSLEIDHQPDYRHWRMTVDTQEDYALVERIYESLYPQNPNFGFSDLRELIDINPTLLDLNRNIEHPKLAGMPKAKV